MKTLTNLTATVLDAPTTPLAGVRAALYHELSPAQFVHISLSAEGLRVWRGTDAVVLPLAEIERLVIAEFGLRIAESPLRTQQPDIPQSAIRNPQ